MGSGRMGARARGSGVAEEPGPAQQPAVGGLGAVSESDGLTYLSEERPVARLHILPCWPGVIQTGERVEPPV